MNREPLPEHFIERIRRERLDPRPLQWDYLHLAGLRRGLMHTFCALPVRSGPTLDLYCGTQPYRELIPWRPLWGYDIDRHFRRTDVVGALPLPFRDDAFSAVLCTQALYQVEDPASAVQEMRRVLAPGGYAVVTVPHIFRRELATDRRYTAEQLRWLFADWRQVQVTGLGGAGTGIAYVAGSILRGAARRWRVARHLLPAAALALNGPGAMLDVILRALPGWWPATLLLVAQRGD